MTIPSILAPNAGEILMRENIAIASNLRTVFFVKCIIKLLFGLACFAW
jgi:hypothetical protein